MLTYNKSRETKTLRDRVPGVCDYHPYPQVQISDLCQESRLWEEWKKALSYVGI